MMTLIVILTAACSLLALMCLKLMIDNNKYKDLLIELTAAVKNMYCNEPGCENIRYSDTPVDMNKGFITDYCQTHLMEHAELSATSD